MGALISVIIPCHNQAHYLGEAIASVSQPARKDVEIVVVDDGSTDGTARVAASFLQTRCVSGPRRGVAHARNQGLRESSGNLLVFLDADDRLIPGALDVGLAEMAANPAVAMVSGRCRMMAEDGTPLPAPAQPRIEKDHYKELLRHNYIWTPAAAMLRRDAVERVSGFDPSVDAAADYSLYLRIARVHAVHDHGRPVAWYRRHASNMSGNAGRMLQETLTVLRRERPFVEGDPGLLRAYYDGWKAWRELYGALLVDEIRDEVQQGHWPRAVRKAAALGWLHPRALVRQAGRKLAITVRPAISGVRRRPIRSAAPESSQAPSSDDE